MDSDDEPVVVTPVASAPAGSGEDELIELGSGPRLPRWLIVAGAGVLAVGAIAAVVVKNTGHHAAPPPPATATTVTPAPPEYLGAPLVQDVAVDGDGGVLVLTNTPWEVVAMEGAGSIRERAPAPARAHLLVADADIDRFWVVAPDAGSSDIYVYARSRMANLSQYRVPAKVSAAATLDGMLWLATDNGIYALGPPPEIVHVPGFTGPVDTIAADPERHRLIGVSSSYDLLTIDASGARVVRRAHAIAPESIVVTREAIWAVGFGRPGGSRQGRIDPRTLAITPVGSADAQAPQGANAWAGEQVFWIKYAYSGALVCHDARTGEVVAAFTDTSDPVASVAGMAYALSGGTLTRLRTTAACPG